MLSVATQRMLFYIYISRPLRRYMALGCLRAILFKNALNRALISGLKLHMTAGNLNDLNLSNLKTGDDD